MSPHEVDLTVMRVRWTARTDVGPVRHTYHLTDRYDPTTAVSSMARTTGYTATALASLLLAGKYRSPASRHPRWWPPWMAL
jgi:lysine 6-dehydrogenase